MRPSGVRHSESYLRALGTVRLAPAAVGIPKLCATARKDLECRERRFVSLSVSQNLDSDGCPRH